MQRLAQVVAGRGEELALAAARLLGVAARGVGPVIGAAQQADQLLLGLEQLLVGEAQLDRAAQHGAVLAHEHRQQHGEHGEDQHHPGEGVLSREQPGRGELGEQRPGERVVGGREAAVAGDRPGAPAAHQHGEQRLLGRRQRRQEQRRRGAGERAVEPGGNRQQARPALGLRRRAPFLQHRPAQLHAGRHDGHRGQRPADEQRVRRVRPAEVGDDRDGCEHRQRNAQPLPAQGRELLGAQPSRDLSRARGVGG